MCASAQTFWPVSIGGLQKRPDLPKNNSTCRGDWCTLNQWTKLLDTVNTSYRSVTNSDVVLKCPVLNNSMFNPGQGYAGNNYVLTSRENQSTRARILA